MKLYASETNERCLSSLEWAFSLRLALLYDWQPAGTGPPSEGQAVKASTPAHWNGGYGTPQCQRMYPPDCDGLADALEKGLLEAMFKEKLYLDVAGLDNWSGLIAFLRTAASEHGLFLVADDEPPMQKRPEGA